MIWQYTTIPIKNVYWPISMPGLLLWSRSAASSALAASSRMACLAPGGSLTTAVAMSAFLFPADCNFVF